MSIEGRARLFEITRIAHFATSVGVLIAVLTLLWNTAEWHATTLATLADHEKRIAVLERHAGDTDDRQQQVLLAMRSLEDSQKAMTDAIGSMKDEIAHLSTDFAAILRQLPLHFQRGENQQ